MPIWCRHIAFAYTAAVGSLSILAITVFLSSSVFAANKASLPTLRWAADAPNCTLREGTDGHTNYRISSGDFEVELSVDRQELEKIPHRATAFLGVFLTFRYKGARQLQVQQNRFALEFVKHHQVVKSSLDPDDLLRHLQENVDDLTDEIERHQVRKHPEQKEKKETELQARLKDYTEMMDFVSTRSLHTTILDTSNASASGWVFFGVKDKWIGPWRKPEQFILKLPVDNSVVEFPFSLPPQEGKVELRRRSAE